MEVLAPTDLPNARDPVESRSLQAFLSGPKYYRGYLTASDLSRGVTGASSMADSGDWMEPLLEALGASEAWAGPGVPRPVSLGEALASPDSHPVLAIGTASPGELPSLPGELREHYEAIRGLLEQGFILLRAEPAHDGHDWSLFAARPLAEGVTEAFRTATPGTARFVIPQRQARGEHKFYFERYDLDLFKAFRVS